MTLLDLISTTIAIVALYQLQDLRKQHNARLTTLERREPDKRKSETFGKPEQVQDKQPEQPKAGTVAAKAIKPVVYLSQVPHKTVQLDNGGLEWEGKI